MRCLALEMTFSVKAVESPSPQLSPYMHPYVSPQMLPQPGQRVPSMSLNDDHVPAKRVGTDPTKYKTTICRNWEQTGTCTFRGCTFAHGVEELRAPTRIDHGGTPLLHSQYVSPGGTPPLMASNTGAAAVSHFGNGNPPKLENLLELLQAEVSRERELVTVHMEANRTLEGMLRREQLQHAETKAMLEERRTEYALLVDVVAQQNAILQTLLQQCDNANGELVTSGGNAPAPHVSEHAHILVERTTALLESGPVHVADGEPESAFAASAAPPPPETDAQNRPASSSSSSSEAGEAKEKEKERIEELLRALQQSNQP